MISLNLRYRLAELRDELVDWSELIFWASIGLSLFLSIITALLWAAWHLIWWVAIEVA
ncbi:hypothetical protein [Dietzia natronolimnaea]|uniref:hypothetical protein n=1 Tax=Dietzia natronolimnaea TaxID=161920 RepID=UPI0015FAAAB1|nr:hypothetical protein [Dietzia natronolimnaea]MBB1037354.1 hypothetical protein [Dietzia natronolimnaea]